MKNIKAKREWLSNEKNIESLCMSFTSILKLIQSLSECSSNMQTAPDEKIYKIDKLSNEWKAIEYNKPWYLEIYNEIRRIVNNTAIDDNNLNLRLSKISQCTTELYEIIKYMNSGSSILPVKCFIDYCNGKVTPFKVEKLRSCNSCFPLLYQALEIDKVILEALPYLEFTVESNIENG